MTTRGDAVVFLACPHNGTIHAPVAASLLTASRDLFPLIHFHGVSVLTHGFNCLWAEALNRRAARGITHFAMLHADVSPDPGWLDILLAEMRRVGADILSAVVPIKDSRGLTSTAWQDPDGANLARFTLREVHQFPRTFDAAGAGKPGKYLLVNTGCWICDFTKPWVEQFPGFQILDAIEKNTDGAYVARMLSEDWLFSRWAAARGLKVFATRAAPLTHHGAFDYRNDSVWGEWETEQGEDKGSHPRELIVRAKMTGEDTFT